MTAAARKHSTYREAAWIAVAALLAAIPACAPAGTGYVAVGSAPDVLGFRTDIADTYTNHSLKSTKPGRKVPQVKQIDDMQFVIGQGSGLHGYTILRIEDNDTGELLIDSGNRAAPNWQLLRFQVGPAELADLKRLLAEVNYFSLPDIYNTDVMDGGQWWIKVKCIAAKKSVYCNNHFPDQAQKISDFLRQRVMPAAMASKQTQPVIDWRKEFERLSDGGVTY